MVDFIRDTMLSLTWPKIEALARQNATVLFPVGVVEEHGPHLPLVTDTLVATELAVYVRDELAAQGQPSVVAPPYYWGIVGGPMGCYPGSFSSDSDNLRRHFLDQLASLKRAGFRSVILMSFHGDWLHVKTFIAICKEATETLGLSVYWLTYEEEAPHQGLTGEEPYVLCVPSFDGEMTEDQPNEDDFDVHAGGYETAQMHFFAPDLVDLPAALRLPPSHISPATLRGPFHGETEGRAILKDQGYVGAPAHAPHVALHPSVYAKAVAAAIQSTLLTR